MDIKYQYQLLIQVFLRWARLNFSLQLLNVIANGWSCLPGDTPDKTCTQF